MTIELTDHQIEHLGNKYIAPAVEQVYRLLEEISVPRERQKLTEQLFKLLIKNRWEYSIDQLKLFIQQDRRTVDQKALAVALLGQKEEVFHLKNEKDQALQSQIQEILKNFPITKENKKEEIKEEIYEILFSLLHEIRFNKNSQDPLLDKRKRKFTEAFPEYNLKEAEKEMLGESRSLFTVRLAQEVGGAIPSENALEAAFIELIKEALWQRRRQIQSQATPTISSPGTLEEGLRSLLSSHSEPELVVATSAKSLSELPLSLSPLSNVSTVTTVMNESEQDDFLESAQQENLRKLMKVAEKLAKQNPVSQLSWPLEEAIERNDKLREKLLNCPELIGFFASKENREKLQEKTNPEEKREYIDKVILKKGFTPRLKP